MKASNLAKVAKIAKINPKKVEEIQDYLAEVMGHFNKPDSEWDTMSDEYILLLCEQYEDEVFQ